MRDIGSAIKDLYQQFLLRDILSFVTPGAIIVLTAFLLFLPEPCLGQRLATLFEYSRSMHWLLYIPLFGLFYAVGFAVQCLGEMFGYVHLWIDDHPPCCKQRWGIFCKLNEDNLLNERTEFERLAKFWKDTKRDEGAQQGRERLVIFMQMCANIFSAVVISGILIGVHFCPWQWLKYFLAILLVVLPLLAALYWGHRVYVLRKHTREEVIKKGYRRRPKKK